MPVIMGILFGAVLALCVGILLFLARKNPTRVKEIAVSFVRTLCGLEVIVTTHTAQFTSIMTTGTEVKLALNIAAEVYGMQHVSKRPLSKGRIF